MRVCRVGVWFGFVRSALLLAVGMCAVLSFGALPGLSCVLRVTHHDINTRAVRPVSYCKPCEREMTSPLRLYISSSQSGSLLQRETAGPPDIDEHPKTDTYKM